MSSQISRRKFLKLLPLLSLPLIEMKWPRVIDGESKLLKNQNRPNVLILVFDTLSAKHMSLYGYNRDTTPNLSRFAERSVVYHSHYAGANFTAPGTASIFTGTYPWSHRAFNTDGTVCTSYEKRSIFSLLPDDYYKIAYTHNLKVCSLLYQFSGNLNLWKKTSDLCLNDANYHDDFFNTDYNTAFWAEDATLVGGETWPSSLFLSWILFRARRIATMKALIREYGHLFPRGIPAIHSLFFLLEDAIDWIKNQVKKFPKPFMGYIHLWPPHAPYSTRHDFVDVFSDGWEPVVKNLHFFSQGKSEQSLNRKRREYDEYVAYTDAEFGRLFDFMEKSGLLDNTYLIITSDHGELFERGILGHTTQVLYEPLIRIPLIISMPGQRRRKDIHTATSCVDLLPTILSATGRPIPAWCEGRILPPFDNQEDASSGAIFAVEAKSNRKQAPLTNATMTIIRDQYKLIHYFGYRRYGNEYELYNLTNDPEELEDLYAIRKSVAASLQNELMEKLYEINQPYL